MLRVLINWDAYQIERNYLLYVACSSIDYFDVFDNTRKWLGGALTLGTQQLNGFTSQEGTWEWDQLSDDQYIAALPNSQEGNSTFFFLQDILEYC